MMKFNKLVEEILLPIFKKYGFRVTEQINNIVNLKSQTIEVGLVYDHLEYRCYAYLGKLNQQRWELDSDTVNYLFGANTQIDYSSIDNFVRDLSFLTENQAGALFKGDSAQMNLLNEYWEARTKKYNEGIMHRQNVNAANRAWDAKNYIDYVVAMDKIKKEKWAKSDELKYQIAIRESEKR